MKKRGAFCATNVLKRNVRKGENMINVNKSALKNVFSKWGAEELLDKFIAEIKPENVSYGMAFYSYQKAVDFLCENCKKEPPSELECLSGEGR